MADFTMPSLGADMEAGTLVEWLVKPGQTVARGDIVAVVETQKGAIDVEIFEDGVIEEILVPVGEKVPVGTVLARVRSEGESASSTEAEPAEIAEEIAEPKAPSPVTAPATAPVMAEPADASHRASPRARRLARELGVDLSTLEGTGPGGSITGEDIQRAAEGAGPEGPSAGDRMRAAIASAMSRSNAEIPHYYLAHTVDLGATTDWLARENATRPIEARLLPIAVLLKAIAVGLRAVPELNGHYRDGKFVPAPTVDLGIAISLRGGGLVAPALSDAASASLSELMTGLSDLVTRARKNALRSSELSRGSVTVTNLGERGVESVFGVIYPPQVALVGLGTVLERPWVVDGELAVRPTVQISLAADHRVSDGHRGGLFLQKVDKLLQSPEKL